MTIKAIVHEEEGGSWAKVPSMPGCYTQGDTMEELVSNLQEAIELWMAPDDPASHSPTEDEGGREIELRYTAQLAA